MRLIRRPFGYFFIVHGYCSYLFVIREKIYDCTFFDVNPSSDDVYESNDVGNE